MFWSNKENSITSFKLLLVKIVQSQFIPNTEFRTRVVCGGRTGGWGKEWRGLKNVEGGSRVQDSEWGHVPMSVRLHHPPSVSIVVKEKNYSDGSINPFTNACAGGRNWSTCRSLGRTWKVCAERTWDSHSSIPGPRCCEAEVQSHWATLWEQKEGKSRRKGLCEPERELCENDWICEAQVIELSGTVGWIRDSVQHGVVPEP